MFEGILEKPITNLVRAKYIWIDGQVPTAKLRAKTKFLEGPIKDFKDIPDWGFDGSSTFQAATGLSDCGLRPVYVTPNPLTGGSGFLVLCEVLDFDGAPHPSNARAKFVETLKKYAHREPLIGFEQEYTLYDKDGDRPFRWPKGGSQFPAPQGNYYCGVGVDEVFGEEMIDAHEEIMPMAGVRLEGTNAEVMAAQWEYQIYVAPALQAADRLWISRYLLYRMAGKFNMSVKLSPKPIRGDWNGAGCHTNFSTKAMREEGGFAVIKEACAKLGLYHAEHIAVYGADNHLRLTGKHETCPIYEFRWAVGDRGASIRIPRTTANVGKGYLEDRRPAANIDPYKVATALIETICGDGFRVPDGWSEWVGWDEYIYRGIVEKFRESLKK